MRGNTMIRSILLTLLLLPLAVSAADKSLGEDSRWFVQVNLAAIRGASDDGALYGWLQREVIEDLEEEFGEGSVDDFDAITVFGTSDNGDGLGIVLDGRMDADMRERVIRRSAATPLEDVGDGNAYVLGGNEELAEEFDIEFDGDPLFMAFGERSGAFVTTSRALLEAFLDGARFERIAASELLIIRADPMLSGAVDTEAIGEGYGNWNSKVMRNIRRAGFALTDAGGGYDVNVELIAVDEAQAQALQNIVQGVIGLQALADEEPELSFVSSLQTQRDGERVSLSVQVSSEELMDLLD
ncbi:hypothetical protein DZC52_14840 [Wenzhouxiangella sediminis]|uniref:DUF2066 domain-containing protein n=2 Tax=Wenzhouxiangella sediminis TaxID=1792836 RepID=A0A3E1K4X9_9GAMM|nr:hypothetical protein DZC52_14840 [Wenzhouxiangella sediminis]